MKVTPNFHFNGNCIEAINLYSKAFSVDIVKLYKNEQLTEVRSSSNGKYKDQVYHAEVNIYGKRVFMTDVDDENYEILSNPLSLTITFNSAYEVRNAYEIMKEDSITISQFQSTPYASAFVSFIDKFGMRWELITEQTEK